ESSNNLAALVIKDNGTTVQMGTAGAGGCPPGPAGVTFIATCSSGTSCGGGFIIGGTGSNTPSVTLSAPSTSPAVGVPSGLLLYEDAAHADPRSTTTLAGGP